jgi:hypothetical protein
MNIEIQKSPREIVILRKNETQIPKVVEGEFNTSLQAVSIAMTSNKYASSDYTDGGEPTTDGTDCHPSN